MCEIANNSIDLFFTSQSSVRKRDNLIWQSRQVSIVKSKNIDDCNINNGATPLLNKHYYG